jgi:cytidylate kinase
MLCHYGLLLTYYNDLVFFFFPFFRSAHFTPSYHVSFYLHGPAGSGKSSLARHFTSALHAAIEQHMDGDVLVRFVKQNLNKPMNILQLELDLRPNNNDRSVMSIIQSRRLTLQQRYATT